MVWKVSIFADEVDPDFDTALEWMKKNGVKDIEPRGIDGKNIADFTDEEARQLKAKLDGLGIGVVALGMPTFKCPLSADDKATGDDYKQRGGTYEEHLSYLRRGFVLGGILGTKIARLFTFWLTDEAGAWEKMSARVAEAAKEAELARFTLAVENEHAVITKNGELVGKLIGEVNSPNLKAIWDTGNTRYLGGIPFPNDFANVRDQIVHVHLKDVHFEDGKTEGKAIGEGDVDFHGNFEALAKDGYDGAITIEPHYRPGGDMTQGAQECLDNLRAILDELGIAYE